MFKKFLNSTIGKIGTIAIIAMLGVVAAVVVAKTVTRPDLVQKQDYVPMRVFDSDGVEYHLFKWDSKGNGNAQDIMFFPECQIGWSDEIDWES